jgi:nucleotide-binding universal stress UspA family protein
MNFTKILCPTDFSEGSQQAVRVATDLAAATNAELVLLHAWFIPPVAVSMEVSFAFNVQDIVDDAQARLDKQVREVIAAGATNTSGELVSGVAQNEIIAMLERQAFDLCVIGTHGRTGIARILLGSVAEKVIRHSPCSVLAVRPGGKVGAFEHILVPTDFSDSATHALELASHLVRSAGEITLLHVVDLPVPYGGELPEPDLARDLDAAAAGALAAAAARITTTRVTTRSLIGSPGAQTLAVLDENPGIDLVVMGSHGRTGIKRMLLGSVAEKVVRHARCPVLVARTRA